ncbi:polysaccharide biosynthesis/export family protein [Curvibacter lanceolatus]|uniref:polysaccharide biosynthesis/export family protein n=1 Tax=Curvibacter lanceolatus TaxID=86182 RepID=UPI001B7F9097|nr:polysaccharide biosynthesis/export family protein [Curvibacter lanceolatus]
MTLSRFLCAIKAAATGVLLLGCAGLVVAADAPASQVGEYALNPQASVRVSALSSYKLAAGDVISIRVLGEDEFTREKIRLTDAGTVSFPAIGEIKVLGRTVGDLEAIVVAGLKGRILVNPKVSVQIDEYRPFYVNGMVDKPGGYPFQPGLTVRKAVSLAGGFKERASPSKIFVIREDDPSQKAQKVDLNTFIGPGDILTVEESFF